jgi:hypothetical protein
MKKTLLAVLLATSLPVMAQTAVTAPATPTPPTVVSVSPNATAALAQSTTNRVFIDQSGENPNVNVTSFDLGRVNAMNYGKQYMDIRFPGRHTLIEGNSTKTVCDFKKNNPNKRFDLIFIDGGHTYDVAKIDIIQSSGLAHKNTIIIVDDIVNVPGWSAGWTIQPTKIWEEGKKFGEIQELGKIVDRPGIGLAWGKYLKSFELDGKFHDLPEES